MSRVIFVLLVAASIGAFARTALGRLGGLRGKRFELPNEPLSKLIRTAVEVLFQTRVIANRPVVGVLHAFVMLGFIVFAWITLNHFWLGLVGLDRAEAAKNWYEHFTAGWSVLTLAGILGLSFRRFVLRPKTLGELSPASALVAFLIAALMATYLASYALLEPGTAAWKANWWAHTLSILGMLWIIPVSKHLHLVLAPITIFFRKDTTSQLRALDLEKEEFGLIKFSEMTGKDILDVNSCVECGRCTDACPQNATGHVLSPKEIILNLQHGALAGTERIAGTAEEVAQGSAWVAEEALFECLSCGACEQACPVGIEHVGAKILDLRRGLASEGRAHSEKVHGSIAKLSKAPHNPWSLPQEVRRKFLEENKFPIFDGGKEWLLWLGCANSYDSHGQQAAAAMKKILDAAGVSYGVLQEEACCGEPARRLGNEALFMDLSQKLVAVLARKGVKKIVTCCPHGATMLDCDYRQIPEYRELGIEVAHHAELLEKLLPKLSLRREPEAVTFHDSCYMARGRGVVDEPRRVLAACGVEVLEPARRGKGAFCCGAGGGQIFVADESKEHPGQRVSDLRWRELAEPGPKAAVVECPFCPIMLKDAADHVKSPVAVLDLAEVVASRLVAGSSAD